MLKWIASTIAGLGLASVAIPAIANLADRDNPAEKLVHATGLANHQAEDLGASYAAIIPTTDPAGHPASPSATPAAQPTLDPKYDAFASPAEHEIATAMAFLDRLLSTNQPLPQNAYIAAATQLQNAWQPRYDKANRDYKVLAYRISHTEKMGSQYFETQARLTNSIIDPHQRERAAANDFHERESYLKWREQADQTLSQARLIKQDLDDMNVIITKQVLSANFTGLYHHFQKMPQSLLSLHAEIAEFQRRSDAITATFGPLSQP